MKQNEMIESLFINILSSLLVELGKAGFLKFVRGNPVDNAIGRTAKEFPELVHVKSSLQKWCTSDEFLEQIEKLTGSIDTIEVAELGDSFCNIGQFSDNIH